VTKIKHSMHNVQDYSVVYFNVVRLYVSVGMLLTCGKHLRMTVSLH